MKEWTKEDMQNFSAFISMQGGKVVKVLELREGYEFSIIPPQNAQPNWSSDRMKEFEAKR